jgi:ferredoxin-NADP reductase
VGNLFVAIVAPLFGAVVSLKAVRKLSADMYEATFDRPPSLQFTPGQYMQWTLPHRADNRGNRRLFSIASSPGESLLRIAFRHYDHSSSFKTALIALSPGKRIRVSHVAGNFTLPRVARPMLWLAGGIGITPFRSMVAYLMDSGQHVDVTLLYFANRPEDFVYRELFDQAAAIGLKVHCVVGRPTAEAIQAAVPDLRTRLAYVSGPDIMVTSCRTMLRQLGVPQQQVKTDHFSGY